MTPCLMKNVAQGAYQLFLLCVFFLLWQLVDGVQVLSFHGTISTLKVISALITLFEKIKIKKCIQPRMKSKNEMAAKGAKLHNKHAHAVFISAFWRRREESCVLEVKAGGIQFHREHNQPAVTRR